jgi:hypothetical protein
MKQPGAINARVSDPSDTPASVCFMIRRPKITKALEQFERTCQQQEAIQK